MALLEIRKLSKLYNKNVRALAGVDLTIKKGEFVAIIGRSGAGKSTLLRCINRLVEATEGEIVVDGIDLCRINKGELRKMRTKIGMIFQHYSLVYRQTVIENVLHGRLGYKSTVDGVLGRYTEAEKERAVEIIDHLGLSGQIYQRCDQLSGGQKQRVGIARALIQNPRIILCDEPIASLDPGAAKVIMDYLHKISRDMDITIIVNLHQVDVALKYADRIVGVKDGQIVFDGTPKKLSKSDIHDIYGSEAGELISD